MRLTLRTLLAYIDHVLDPKDAKELAAKIRESKLAQHTMERIDKGLTSRSLRSPSASKTNDIHDPNVLAEYLDNTLRPEDVPQFERHCFESDAQLIEAASVHQILSAVLTKPIHVSNELNLRLKQLVQGAGEPDAEAGKPNPIEVPPVVTATSVQTPNSDAAKLPVDGQRIRLDPGNGSRVDVESTNPTADALQARTNAPSVSTHGLDLSDRHNNSVPEYLRDRSEGVVFQYALVAALVVALGFVTWKIVGPWDQVQTLFSASPKLVQSTDESNSISVPSSGDKATQEESSIKASVDASSGIAVDESSPIPAQSNVPTPIASADNSAIVESDASPVPPDAAVATDAAMKAATDVAPPQAEPNTEVPETAIAMDNGSPIPDSVPAPIIADETAPVPPAGDSAAAPATPPQAETTGLIAWQPETKESAAAIVLALDSSDDGQQKLRIVNIADQIPSSTRIIIPDAYRTELRVQPGLKWTVASATDLQAQQGDAPKTAYAQLRIGRALLSATADCSSLILRAGGQEFKIDMDSPTAVASVEVRYFARPGVSISESADAWKSDPKLGTQSLLMPIVTLGSVVGKAQVFVRRGVSWSDADEIEAGSVVAFVDGQRKGPHSLSEIPWWYRTSIERPIDAGAAEDLALELQVPTDEPDQVAQDVESEAVDLFVTLREATKVRRAETAALAARTLALLGHYDTIFGKDAVLNQSNSRPHRSLIIESVLQSLAIDPQYATRLTQTLQEYDPPRGSRLLSLLVLPDAKTMTDPAGAQPFVDALSSSYLDERVVGIHQLNKITGKEYTYQADRVTSEALSQWRKVQSSGKINWNSASIKPLDWE